MLLFWVLLSFAFSVFVDRWFLLLFVVCCWIDLFVIVLALGCWCFAWLFFPGLGDGVLYCLLWIVTHLLWCLFLFLRFCV